MFFFGVFLEKNVANIYALKEKNKGYFYQLASNPTHKSIILLIFYITLKIVQTL